MARLPIPGSDENTWGTLLNDYLSVAHDASGVLKSDAVNSSAIQDDSITESKLASGSGTNGQVLTKNTGASGGLEWAAATAASDATTTSKGIVQLAGDLAGTAAAPTVPSLANKANSSTTISAGTGLSGGGDLSANRTISANFGTTAGTIAEGNDSRITGAVQSSLADAKGDLLVASAADTVAKLSAGTDGQVLTANSAGAAGVAWTTPNDQIYPLEAGYGYHSASVPIESANVVSSFAGWHTRIWVPAGKVINSAAMVITIAAAGTPLTLAGFALYTDDGQTKLGETTPDSSLFLSTGYRQATFPTPIAAQSAGRFVRVVVSSDYSTSGPSCHFAVGDGPASGAIFNGGLAVRTAFLSALSSFPATFNPTTGAGLSWTETYFLPLILLG